MPKRKIAVLAFTAFFSLFTAIAGCGAPADGSADSANLGQAHLSLLTVPSNILCVQVKVTIGTQTTTVNVNIDPAVATPVLSLGQLPLGSATFNSSAFTQACSTVTSSTIAAWISDPVTTTLQAGVVANVDLTFRRNNPVNATVDFLDNVAAISSGFASTYARMVDGTVKQWGKFSATQATSTPQNVPGLTGAIQVVAGIEFACARKTDGTVVCWGTNAAGQLGPAVALGATVTTPVAVPVPFGVATDLAAGQNHVCAITGSGDNLFCWGFNANGQLGNGTTSSSATPVSVGTYSRVFAGGSHTCAVTGAGTLNCWGGNFGGQLGDGTTTDRLLPVFVPVFDVTDMGLGFDFSCALRGDSTVRCWGNNGMGQIGDGTTVQRLSPVAVSGLTDATMIAGASQTSCVRRSNGAVSCWGGGNSGTVGDGSGDNKLTPVAVSGLSGIVAVRGHLGTHVCAETSTHSAKCWGNNIVGQIGDGTRISRPTPVSVLLQ
jgi:alpha-tubulin suppressor-like RCC1 family protein